jgi:hypothetical protein
MSSVMDDVTKASAPAVPPVVAPRRPADAAPAAPAAPPPAVFDADAT